MRVRLKGIHKTTSKAGQEYYYAWRGGPRLEGKPGTPDFIASYNEAIADRRKPAPGTMFTIISEYRGSSAFANLRDTTRRDYARYLKLIENEFGTLPLEALTDPAMRGEFMAWRDGLATSPRAADFAWTVLARVLSVAKDRGRITVNPCERGGKLHASSRKDNIWSEAQIDLALARFPAPLCHALRLAQWTGQRQGDLLTLKWHQVGLDAIRLTQSKTGQPVAIPIKKTLRAILEAIPRVSTVILTSSHKHPWTSSGFQSSWGRACKAAGIEDVTFNDLRGTTVTCLAEEGAGEAEIAAITGHSLRDVRSILDRHYLSRSFKLAESAVMRLERKEKRTQSAKKLRNAQGG